MEYTWGTLAEVLAWVVSGGGAMVLAGYVMAYLLANVPWFQTLPRWVKVVVPILLAAGIAALAQSVVSLGLLDSVPPEFQVLVLFFINWLFSQFAYRGIKSDDRYAKLDGAPKG